MLPEAEPDSEPSWFGFLITCKEAGGKLRLVRALEENKIQTRMLFAGNLIKHPCFDAIRGSGAYRVSGSLDCTDRIMNDTFWVGVYPGMNDAMLDKMADVIKANL